MAAEDDKRVPADGSDNEGLSEDDETNEKTKLLLLEPSPIPDEDEADDPGSQQPAPSPLKRFVVIVLFILLFWLAFQLGSSKLSTKRKPQIIYASRYSKEHRFRPAASPIITETLKDGRIRLRGALPTEEAKPVPKKKTTTGRKKSKKTTRKSQKKK